MALAWRLAYRLGITPWEWVGAKGIDQLEAVLAREESLDRRLGRALDIGCGSGNHAITLATRGWAVTGIDVVPLAIERAGARAAAAHVGVTFLVADVRALADVVEPGFRLVLDVGCFHALDDATRDAYAAGVQAVTEAGATLIMVAFQPNHRLAPGPRGVTTSDVLRRFPHWTLEGEDPVEATLPRPLRHLAPRVLMVRRAR